MNTKTTQPAWADDTTAAEASSVAFASNTIPRTAKVVRAKGKSGINCKQALTGVPFVSMNLRVPPSVIERLKRLTDGHHSVAAWALIEDALIEIENKRERWTITIE